VQAQLKMPKILRIVINRFLMLLPVASLKAEEMSPVQLMPNFVLEDSQDIKLIEEVELLDYE
jgi:hypothetical protein